MSDWMHFLKRALAAMTLALPVVTQSQTQAQAQPTPASQQYLYVLRLPPRLHDPKAWTPQDNAAVGRHFERLQQATAAGKVILAGRTSEPLDQTFGLVVFEAEGEAAARRFMEEDPAVVAGVMTATLHPYSVALLRK